MEKTSIGTTMHIHDVDKLDLDAFVEVAYFTVLDRPIDTTGRAYYLERLKNGMARWQVLTELAVSPEGMELGASNKILGLLDKLDGDAFIEAAYFTILGRAIDSTGRTHYSRRLKKGVPRWQVLAELAASREGMKYGISAKIPSLDILVKLYRKRKNIFSNSSMINTVSLGGAVNRVTSVNDLFCLYDETFINACYIILLNRTPDPAGMRYYLARVRQGVDRRSVLSQIHMSQEGKQYVVTLPGVNKVINEYRWHQTPFIGRLLRLISGADRVTDRQWRSFENAFFSFKEKSLENFYALDERIASYESRATDRHGFPAPNKYRYPAFEQSFTQESLGSPDIILFFNLSTSFWWRSRVVGIVRMERELAIYLRKYINVVFVVWDKEEKQFLRLSDSLVDAILSEKWVNPESSIHSHFDLNAETKKFVMRNNGHIISVGLDWDYTPTDEMYKLCERTGAELTLFCHDTIPILFPELCVRSDFDQTFKKHLTDAAHAAKRIICNSHNTKKDLERFFRDASLLSVPDIRVCVGAAHFDDDLPDLTEDQAGIIRNLIHCGKYVLYVSSIEARKNHRMLVNIWRELYLERGNDCPQLVFVGMKGWGTKDLLNQVYHMHATKAGKIIVLDSVSDDLLKHIYANADFCLFPSIYEGWGLSASEALSYGKVVISSSGSALQEATGGLAPSYHPLDFLAWKKEIETLLDDRIYKMSLERKIRHTNKHRSWNDFGKEFCQILIESHLSLD